jgi:hypothetical protein
MSKSRLLGGCYMFKNCLKTVSFLLNNCEIFCVKMWVKTGCLFNVGKNLTISTFRPTIFQQSFLTHTPLLNSGFYTLSTPLITIIINKKEKIL